MPQPKFLHPSPPDAFFSRQGGIINQSQRAFSQHKSMNANCLFRVFFIVLLAFSLSVHLLDNMPLDYLFSHKFHTSGGAMDNSHWMHGVREYLRSGFLPISQSLLVEGHNHRLHTDLFILYLIRNKHQLHNLQHIETQYQRQIERLAKKHEYSKYSLHDQPTIRRQYLVLWDDALYSNAEWSLLKHFNQQLETHHTALQFSALKILRPQPSASETYFTPSRWSNDQCRQYFTWTRYGLTSPSSQPSTTASVIPSLMKTLSDLQSSKVDYDYLAIIDGHSYFRADLFMEEKWSDESFAKPGLVYGHFWGPSPCREHLIHGAIYTYPLWFGTVYSRDVIEHFLSIASPENINDLLLDGPEDVIIGDWLLGMRVNKVHEPRFHSIWKMPLRFGPKSSDRNYVDNVGFIPKCRSNDLLIHGLDRDDLWQRIDAVTGDFRCEGPGDFPCKVDDSSLCDEKNRDYMHINLSGETARRFLVGVLQRVYNGPGEINFIYCKNSPLALHRKTPAEFCRRCE